MMRKYTGFSFDSMVEDENEVNEFPEKDITFEF